MTQISWIAADPDVTALLGWAPTKRVSREGFLWNSPIFQYKVMEQ
jgi:hypothetical protein